MSRVINQAFTKFPHYDAHGPGLLGPLPGSGYCFHDERLDVDVDVWIDFDAPLMSGDGVVLFHEDAGVIRAIGKWLQYTSDGRWWGVAYLTREEDSLAAVPLDHPAFRFGGVAAIVAKLETPRDTPRAPSSDERNRMPERQRFFEAAGGAQIRHWRTHGYPPRVRWDFSTPPENRAVIRTVFGPSPPDPLPRFPLVLAASCT